MPRSVIPRHYALWLKPDLASAAFDGSVDIDVDIETASTRIVLNSIELDISHASIESGGTVSEAALEFDEATERVTLVVDDSVAPGPAKISMRFTGVLNDKLRGFYRSTYSDESGTEHAIATTQFESTNARRCFPCWDEPDFKATFDVSLEIDDELLAVSAQPELQRTVPEPGRVRIDFATTPKMSTYLLAFVVGPLEASPEIDVDGIPVRIIHRIGHGDEIAFAHDAAVFCLRWLTDYFGVPYFGDKIDLLAIPDFAFGAMENTGCVTFREVLLLVDPAATTQPEQQRSVAVIAHELAHMWFGNLVTMQWWEGLWLKEAFATFMETAATDAYRPDWKVWEGFALERSAAYAVDALHSTRPIEFEVVSPADAEGMYDVLTYEKGASVVRMLEQFVGAEKFREGIRHYMQDHAFGNTVTSDLWNAIESATQLPIADMMQEWIYVGGFPLVEARLVDGEVELEQQPFKLLDTSAETDIEWNVPVEVSSGSDNTTVLMVPHGRVPLDQADATVVVDPHSNGFFRVHYDDELTARLRSNLMTLTSGQRYSLFDDLFDLVRSGRASVEDFVTLARSLDGETSPSVWSAVISGFATLAFIAPDRATRDRVGDAFATIAGPQLDALGFERAEGESDDLINEVRSSLFGALGALSKRPDIVEHARSLVANPDGGTNASMDSAAVRVVASNGSRADYDAFFERFSSATSPQIERRYLFALARFDDASAIDDLCARTLDGSVRSQDAAYLLGAALANRWHGERVWQFVQQNWHAISDRVPDNAVGRMLAGVQWLAHLDDAESIHAFLAEHDVPQARQAIAQHLERLEVHRKLIEREASTLPQALRSSS